MLCTARSTAIRTHKAQVTREAPLRASARLADPREIPQGPISSITNVHSSIGYMTPPKRKGGRVTPKRAPTLPLAPLDPLELRARKTRTSPRGPQAPNRSQPTPAQGRYTPPKVHPEIRFRPEWHKVAGAVSLVFGLALFVVCTFNVWGIHGYGGHIWYVVGLAIAASSIWWWGGLDPVG